MASCTTHVRAVHQTFSIPIRPTHHEKVWLRDYTRASCSPHYTVEPTISDTLGTLRSAPYIKRCPPKYGPNNYVSFLYSVSLFHSAHIEGFHCTCTAVHMYSYSLHTLKYHTRSSNSTTSLMNSETDC